MPGCVAYGCTNNSNKRNPDKRGLTFHKFPKDEEIKRLWIRAVRRKHWKPSEYSVLCSEHFKEDDFDRTSPFRIYLKKEAIPSYFKGMPDHLQPKFIEERRALKRELECLTVSIEPGEIEGTDESSQKELELMEITIVEMKDTRPKTRNSPKKDEIRIIKRENECSSISFDLPEPEVELMDSSLQNKIEMLEETIGKMKEAHAKTRNALKCVKKKNIRMALKIVRLTQIIQALKSKSLHRLNNVNQMDHDYSCPPDKSFSSDAEDI